ncbi:hypothetical protein AB1Y20_019020 [Prymnesium parvum]|uniref:Uncharacterized protein n=1 Tax=Prymnesium parvum TaxID=97485 RepID=A0AB34JTT2_PRYPA
MPPSPRPPPAPPRPRRSPLSSLGAAISSLFRPRRTEEAAAAAFRECAAAADGAATAVRELAAAAELAAAVREVEEARREAQGLRDAAAAREAETRGAHEAEVRRLAEEKAQAVEEKARAVEEKAKAMEENERAVEEKEKAVREKEKALGEKEKEVEEKVKAVEAKDKAVEEAEGVAARLRNRAEALRRAAMAARRRAEGEALAHAEARERLALSRLAARQAEARRGEAEREAAECRLAAWRGPSVLEGTGSPVALPAPPAVTAGGRAVGEVAVLIAAGGAGGVLAAQLAAAAALWRWREAAAGLAERHEARRLALLSLMRGEERREMARGMGVWAAAALAMESAYHQQVLHEMALMQVIQRAESNSQRESSRRGSSYGRHEGDRASSKRSDSTTELQGSLRSLGANILRVAKSQTRDARTVVAAPGKLFCATRALVPRLAEHVSPARLINSLLKEVNDSLESPRDDDEYVPTSPSEMGSAEQHSGVTLPTEEALREHDEELAARDAATAAAQVLSRLPVATGSDWCGQSGEWPVHRSSYATRGTYDRPL